MNVWVVIATSALASACINVIANFLMRRWEHAREDAKEVEDRKYIYLDVALQLEDFSAKASFILGKIQRAIFEARSNHDQRYFDALESISFKFDPGTNWRMVSIDVASRAQGFSRSFVRSQDFIFSAFECWAGVDDAWEYDSERIAYYGLEAINFASELRESIGAGPDSNMKSFRGTFHEYIAQRRAYFRSTPTRGTVIPELFEKFQREDFEDDAAEQKSHSRETPKSSA